MRYFSPKDKGGGCGGVGVWDGVGGMRGRVGGRVGWGGEHEGKGGGKGGVCVCVCGGGGGP